VLVLLVVHVLAAVAAPLLVRGMGARAFYVLAVVPGAAVAWAAVRTPGVLAGHPAGETHEWVPAYHLYLVFRLTPLALIMVYLVAGIGALVLFYCARYFRPDEPGLGSFAGVLTAFAGAMLGLVLADDLVLMYVFWELTSVFSYLLVGHKATSGTSRRAAMQALLVTTLGGLAMLAGIVLLDHAGGTSRVSALLEHPPGGAVVPVALALILIGAVSKSALVPFHFWLPGAMAAPTPVSAYLHAAAMVKAGVFLVALLAPAYAAVAPWRAIVLTLGCVTMLLGAWRALRQHDLKLLLAYGTVSQLGFLIVLLGAGTANAAQAGAVMLVAHAMFKAALFLFVGIADTRTGTRDLRELSGLGRTAPVLATATVLAGASMAGVPPLLGFAGKESAFGAFPGDPAVLAVLVIGSALTFAYTARFLWGALARKPGVPDTPVRPIGPLFAGPTVLLALTGLATGCALPYLEPLIGAYVGAYPGHADHLALWHGLTVPLGLSALAITSGLVLFAARFRPRRLVRFTADHAYDQAMRALDRLAVHVTGFTQRGSLPVYLGVILATLVVVPGGALVATGLGRDLFAHAEPWDSPAQAVVVALMLAGAVGTVRARVRLAGVLLAGVTGYGTALLFVLHGAPDLGLTQFLSETVLTVLFVLVLRRLPRRPAPSPRRPKAAHAALGVIVGALVGGLALTMTGARHQPPVSTGLPAAAEKGGGKNIVNVTLVDVRAWDTMGEVSVLAVAATGVTSLIFLRGARRLPRLGRHKPPPGGVWATRRTAPGALRPLRPGTVARGAVRWLSAVPTLSPERRSVIFEVVTRLLFHPMIVLSLYLTFSGHNTTGGGFAGGIVAGLALLVRYLAGGRYELAETAPVGPGLLIGLGLVAATGTGLAAMIGGGPVLGSTIWHAEVPLLGEVHLVTSAFFDLGVYLIVVGLVLDILRSLGAEIDRQVGEEAA